jgi:hypothetical protein
MALGTWVFCGKSSPKICLVEHQFGVSPSRRFEALVAIVVECVAALPLPFSLQIGMVAALRNEIGKNARPQSLIK